MGNLMLRSQIAVMNEITRASDAARNRLQTVRERGDIVQTILIIAVFVGIIVVVGSLLYKALNNQGTNLANCIDSAGSSDPGNNCTNYKG